MWNEVGLEKIGWADSFRPLFRLLRTTLIYIERSFQIKVKLSPSQKEKYKDMVSVHSSESGIVQATYEHSGMSIMMDMRKLSNHPLLMRYYYTDQKVMELAKRLSTHPQWKKTQNPQHIFEDLAICSDFQLYQMIEKYVS